MKKRTILTVMAMAGLFALPFIAAAGTADHHVAIAWLADPPALPPPPPPPPPERA